MSRPLATFHLISGSLSDLRLSAIVGEEITLTIDHPKGRGVARGIVRLGMRDVTDSDHVINQYVLTES